MGHFNFKNGNSWWPCRKDIHFILDVRKKHAPESIISWKSRDFIASNFNSAGV